MFIGPPSNVYAYVVHFLAEYRRFVYQFNFHPNRDPGEAAMVLNPNGSKYRNARYLPKAIITIPNAETIHTPYSDILDP